MTGVRSGRAEGEMAVLGFAYPEQNPGSPAPEAVRQETDFREDLYEWAGVVVFVLALVVLLNAFVARQVVVSGPSMENTLQGGNRVLVSDFRYTPHQGDIVVLYATGIHTTIIKRVAAVGGQTIDIDYAHNRVLVDGKTFSAPIKEPMQSIGADGDGYGTLKLPLKVPEGDVFVLGDNRNISKDSRYAEVGLIPVQNLMGRVMLRIAPFTLFSRQM